jgi:hypothetical protein
MISIAAKLIVIGATTLAAAWGVYRLTTDISTDIEDEFYVQTIVDETATDTVVDDFTTDDNTWGLDPKMYRSGFIASLIKHARYEYGPLSECEANRLMVRRFLRDAMRKRGMREAHVAKHLDVATSLYFVPLHVEVETARLRKTLVVARLEDALLRAQAPSWIQWWTRRAAGV